MNRTLKSSAGVTLLEIMLVLAIAALVIVMSIRYYTQASNSQTANDIISEIQNVAAAVNNLYQGSGSYAAASTATVTPVAGTANMTTPLNTAITVTGAASSVTITVAGLPQAICNIVLAKITTSDKFTSSTVCGAGTTSLVVVYTP